MCRKPSMRAKAVGLSSHACKSCQSGQCLRTVAACEQRVEDAAGRQQDASSGPIPEAPRCSRLYHQSRRHSSSGNPPPTPARSDVRPAAAFRGALRPAPSEDQATSRPAAQADRAIVGSEGATAADRRQRLRARRA